MTNSETNTASSSSGFVSDALSRLHLLGFGHVGTLAAMRRVAPVCPSATRSERVCASLSLPSARRLRSSSVRVPGCLPDGFPPAPSHGLLRCRRPFRTARRTPQEGVRCQFSCAALLSRAKAVANLNALEFNFEVQQRKRWLLPASAFPPPRSHRASLRRR